MSFANLMGAALEEEQPRITRNVLIRRAFFANSMLGIILDHPACLLGRQLSIQAVALKPSMKNRQGGTGWNNSRVLTSFSY
jgi:hypothetical protein